MDMRALLMAGLTGAAKPAVDDLFSAYAYVGNGGAQSINNGIDLAGKGGLVWTKQRSSTASHGLFDTARSASDGYISSNLTNARNDNYLDSLTAFNSNGFTLGADANDHVSNLSGYSYASWTFRKSKKFFDIVTYTGDGFGARDIPHNLSATPGMIMVKRTDAVGEWFVSPVSLTNPGSGSYPTLRLQTTAALETSTLAIQNCDASKVALGPGGTATNINGATYVMYLFGHDTSADGVIQCGSFVEGSSPAIINLGWEPQFLMMKPVYDTGHWFLVDASRGFSLTSGTTLYTNLNNGENAAGMTYSPAATGFTTSPGNFGAGTTIFYMAIRRSNKPPTSGAQVFNTLLRAGTGSGASVVGAGFPPDFAITSCRNGNSNHGAWDRLRGGKQLLRSDITTASTGDSLGLTSFDQDGFSVGADTSYATVNYSGYNFVYHLFKRARGFMDVAIFKSGNPSPALVYHNLGVTPELIILKERSATGWGWMVASSKTIVSPSSPWYADLALNSTAAAAPSQGGTVYNPLTVTAASFQTLFGAPGVDCMAYLFATLPGVSKVFSYTGNGTSQTVPCGFSNGARFVLIKRTDSAGDWYVWDSVRGIVAGNDPHLSLNTATAETATDDSVDPDPSGFIVNQLSATNINVNAATYIGLAIA